MQRICIEAEYGERGSGYERGIWERGVYIRKVSGRGRGKQEDRVGAAKERKTDQSCARRE